jgi:predicted enzyme related to lactoylglutathione lyase
MQKSQSRETQNEHLDAYLSVSGIRSLLSELQERGAHVIRPLEQQPWSCMDFYVDDPHGYILCFSEPNA